MGQFASLYDCTLGGANFQLATLKEQNKSVHDGGRETARQISIAGEGWVDGTSGADLATKIAAVRAAMVSPGKDFTVTGLGGATYCQVLAAQCLNGGPFVDYEAQDSDSPLVHRFAFSITAEQSPGIAQNPPSVSAKEDTRKLTVEVGPDGLETVGIDSSVSGPNSQEFFLNTILPQWQAQYPWPSWVVKYKYDINLNNDKLEYSISAKELAQDMPNPIAGAVVVDGDLLQQGERDGERILFTTSCDFLIEGDPQKVATALRPAGSIVKESVEISTRQEVRLRASFTELRSADGTGLLEWESSVEAEREDAIARAVPYDGVKVDLVYDVGGWHLAVSGRAVGIRKYPKEVFIAPPNGYVADAMPKVQQRRASIYERETSWSQSFAGTRGLNDLEIKLLQSALGRPATPTFY